MICTTAFLPLRKKITKKRKAVRAADRYSSICQTLASSINLTPSPTVDHKTPAESTKAKPRR